MSPTLPVVKPKQPESNLRIWLFNVMDAAQLGDFHTRAKWDCHLNYKSREGNSAALLLEYDAVIWRAPQAMPSDPERDRQLQLFLSDESKVFVFLFDQCEQFPPTLRNLFGDSSISDSIRTNKSGYDLRLTPFGEISPFRQYLEDEHNRWHVAFPPAETLAPLALDAEGEAVAFTMARYRNRAFFLPAPTNDKHKSITGELI